MLNSLDPNQSLKKSLKISELVVLFSLLFLVGSFVLVAKWTSVRRCEEAAMKEAQEPLIAVEVTGCVYRPRTVFVPEGSTMELLFCKVKPKPFADLSKFPMGQVIDRPCLVQVDALKELTVTIEGCVKEKVELKLPVGSRLYDLRRLVVFEEGADKSFLNRKRKLRPNEIILIPKVDE